MDKEQVLYEQFCRLASELERERIRHRETKRKLIEALQSREYNRGQAAAYGSSVSRSIAIEVAELLREELYSNESTT